MEPVGDFIGFYSEIKELKPKRLSWQDSLYQGIDTAFTPGAIRKNGFEPGFRLYFPLGLRLRFSTNLSPFLTWKEGTVDMDNPTALSKWVLLSFRSNQAPVLLTFEQPVQLVITGESGDWTLNTVKPFKGWMRLMTPFGPEPMGATVGALGAAVKKLTPHIGPLSQMAPELIGFETRSDDYGITAIWTFDRAGAQIPMPLLLSKAGGYSTSVLTGVSSSSLEMSNGPVQWSTEPRIAVRFPARRIPAGRALTVGDIPISGASTVSALDFGGVAELGLATLISGRESRLQELVESVKAEFSAGVPSVVEPHTGKVTQILSGGKQCDTVAAKSLVDESLLSAQWESSPGAPLAFTMLQNQFDWQTWRVWSTELKSSARATGLMALAGGISQNEERRFWGAMAQAGHAALQAQAAYRSKRSFPALDVDSIPAPYVAIRASLYSVGDGKSIRMPFVESLLSPVRVLGSYRVASEFGEKGYLLSWEHEAGVPKSVNLLSGFAIEVEAKENLKGIKPMGGLGVTQLVFEPEAAGKCQVLLRLPSWASKLPQTIPVPRYSE